MSQNDAHPGIPVAWKVAALAERQHGMVSRAQLRELGIDGTAVARGIAAGRLHRIHRGVYAVGHRPRTSESRWIAAVLACGADAVLSHLDAAALWAIYRGEGARVHVIAQSRRVIDGIWAHRARRLHPDDVTVHQGIPVTTVARTLVDLTDVLGGDRVLRALREAEYQRLLDLDALTAAVERAHGRKRLRTLKAAIARHRPGQIVRDELEHRFLELIHPLGLPEPETNVKVNTKRRTYEVDCLWRAQGVAVELDGRAAHQRASAFEEDRKRDAALSAVGLRPLRFTWERVNRDGGEVAGELAAVLSA